MSETTVETPEKKTPKKASKKPTAKKAAKKPAGPSKCEKLREWFKNHKDSSVEQRHAYGKSIGLAESTVNTQFSAFNRDK